MSERRRVLSATFTGHTRVPTLGQVEIATASPALSLFCDGSELLMAYREAGQPRLEAVPVNSGAVLRIVYEGDETLAPAAPVVPPVESPVKDTTGGVSTVKVLTEAAEANAHSAAVGGASDGPATDSAPKGRQRRQKAREG